MYIVYYYSCLTLHRIVMLSSAFIPKILVPAMPSMAAHSTWYSPPVLSPSKYALNQLCATASAKPFRDTLLSTCR